MTIKKKGFLTINDDGSVFGNGALFSVFTKYMATLSDVPQGPDGVGTKRTIEPVVRAFCSMLDFIDEISGPTAPPADGTTIANGTYVGELVVWDGTAWVPSVGGFPAFTIGQARPNDDTGKIALQSGAGFIGIELAPLIADAHATVRAPLNGNAFLIGDSSDDGHYAHIGVAFGAEEKYGFRVGTITDEIGGHILAISFFNDQLPIKQQLLQGNRTSEKTDSLITILANYGLIADSTVDGDWTDFGPFSTVNSTPQLLKQIVMSDDSVITVEYLLIGRDTGNNWYKYKYVQEYTKVIGGNATLFDSSSAAPAYEKNNISGFTGASISTSGAAVNFNVAGSGSVAAHGFWFVRIDTVYLGHA